MDFERGRNIDVKEKHWLPPSHVCPNHGWNLEPPLRALPGGVSEAAAVGCMGQCPNQLCCLAGGTCSTFLM